MKIAEITASAGRTFNHPYERYSNFRPGVTLKATLDEGDDPDACMRALQARAEALLTAHVEQLLQHCKETYLESVNTRDDYEAGYG